MMRAALKKLYNKWIYLGYSKEKLCQYENRIAKDNLTVLQIMLFGTVLILFVILILLNRTMEVSPGTGHQITHIIPVISISLAMTILLILLNQALKNREEKVSASRILTVLYLSLINLTAIIVEVVFYPEEYSTVACGLLLISQISFISYPMDNLVYICCVSGLFMIMDIMFKQPSVYIYDLLDSIPFWVWGLILQWKKSQLKYEALVHAENEKRLEIQNMENELRQSRIDVMLTQIQPHFIYNTLEGIGELCYSNPAYAEQAVTEFSSYLRGNLSAMDNQKIIPFEQELAHVKHYLYCEKMRFDERLCIVYDIQAMDFSVPTLSLQPIVENAVRYGISRKEEGGTVTIETRQTEEEWLIVVSDDGNGFSDDSVNDGKRKHIGIKNVRYRLKQQCEGTLDIQSVSGVGTKVIIKIPKKEQQEWV